MVKDFYRPFLNPINHLFRVSSVTEDKTTGENIVIEKF